MIVYRLIFILIIVPQVLYGQNVMLNRFDILEHQASFEDDSSNTSVSSMVQYDEQLPGDYFKILPLYLHSSWNSEYAEGFNDGSFWQGKGINQAISLGLQGRKGRVEYTLAPIFTYAQNLSYDYGIERSSLTRNRFQYQYTSDIDYVMRYGDEALTNFHLGQSEIGFRLNKIKLSLGTTNQWWGPGVYQSALMSNNAAGFLHLDIGNHKLYQSSIGGIGFHFSSGVVNESDYFNDQPDDDQSIFNGFVLTYKPSFFDGLTISANRAMMLKRNDSESLLDYAMIITDFFRTSQKNPDGTITEAKDQIISLGFDWQSTTDGFRVYLEWVRGDFWSDISDLLEQPDHNSGFILGFAKDITLNKPSQKIRLSFEHANLATWETVRLRPSGPLYTHGSVTQGYTNNGQILGASIGPGSSFHGLTLSWIKERSSYSIEYLRTRYNDDYFFRNRTSSDFDIQHHVALFYKLDSGKYSVLLNAGVGIRDNPFFRDDYLTANIRSEMVLRIPF